MPAAPAGLFVGGSSSSFSRSDSAMTEKHLNKTRCLLLPVRQKEENNDAKDTLTLADSVTCCCR